MNLKRLPTEKVLAAHPEPALQVARVECLGDTVDQAPAGLGVGVPGWLALAADAGDEHRLRPAVLLDSVLAVAEPDPGLLPPAHRHVHRDVVDDHVVDVDGSGLDPPRNLLGPLLLAEDRAGEAVAGVVGQL